MIPSIANYFGVTIDDLFGYHNDRERRIDGLVSQIQSVKWKNNGVDVNINETIGFARNALVACGGSTFGKSPNAGRSPLGCMGQKM